MARWSERVGPSRGDVVFTAWARAWAEDAHARLDGDEPSGPSAAVLAGLSDDEAAFVVELVAGRLDGSVVEAIECRFGRATSAHTVARRVVPVEPGVAVRFDDERRRRRGPMPAREWMDESTDA